MFRKKCADPFNKKNNRNIRNTKKRSYNCAGYALETYSWYCPHNEKDEGYFFGFDYSFYNKKEAIEKTRYSVNVMIKDFKGKIREIQSLDELNKETERVIAFRLSSDGDFHYIKKMSNGQWYHKMGSSYYIEKMSEQEVFHSVWCNRYDGPIALLAIKK